MIYELTNQYVDLTGDYPKFLHIHPDTLCSLAMGSLRAHDGMYYVADGEVMFMDYHIDKDTSMPTDTILLDGRIKYSIKIIFDTLQELFYVQAVKVDGSAIGKPFKADTMNHAIKVAKRIQFDLGQDYEYITIKQSLY